MIFPKTCNPLLILIIFSACLTNSPIKCADFNADVLFDDSAIWDTVVNNSNITRAVTNVDALTTFTSIVKINNVVSDSFFLHTNPINDRTLDSMPVYNIWHSNNLNTDCFFTTYILYNEIYKQYFTKNSSNIGSYIRLNTNDVIDKLDSSVANLDVPPILELFQQAKVQERRLGLMFQVFKNYGHWSFDATLPLIYQERNFFFTDSEQAIIQQELSKITGSTSPSVNRDYFTKLAVSDRIGFSNLKFKAGHTMLSNDTVKLKAGLVSTLPISFAFKKGLVGSDFRKDINTPTMDLKQVYEWYTAINSTHDPVATADFKDFSTDFLQDWAHRLGAMLLNQSLGNEHHFTIGAFSDAKIAMNTNASCLFYGEFLYAVPKKELRFFNQIKNPADFTTAALTDDVNALPPGPAKEALAATKIEFLNVNSVSSMFPTAAWAKVAPRFAAQLSVGPFFEFGPCTINLGYNLWHRCQEHLSNVIPIESAMYPLDIPAATASAATQHKLFLIIDYSKITPWHVWSFAFCFDQTLGSTGIGKDFNLALELSVDF